MGVAPLTGLHLDEELKGGIRGWFLRRLQVINILMNHPQENGASNGHLVPIIVELKEFQDVIKCSNQKL